VEQSNKLVVTRNIQIIIFCNSYVLLYTILCLEYWTGFKNEKTQNEDCMKKVM